MTTARHRCPRCGSLRVAEILYGTPAHSRRLERDVSAGRVVLAGCLVTDDAPARQCADCGHGFGVGRARPLVGS
jgi:hypothetical protein